MANSIPVTVGPVRLSYLNVFKPRAMSEGQDPKYSACLLIPKSDAKSIKAIKDACESARLASAGLFNGKVPDKLKSPIHDGDGSMPNGGEYGPEAKGMWVINVSAKNPPVLVDKRRNAIIDSTQLYSGCWGNAAISLAAYNTQGNRGIGAYLNGIQKIRDDEPLGGKQRAEDMFTVMDEEDDDLGL